MAINIQEKSKERLRRMEIIENSLQQANKLKKVVFEDPLISEIIGNFSVSLATANDYLRELEMRNIIVRDKGEVSIQMKEANDGKTK